MSDFAARLTFAHGKTLEFEPMGELGILHGKIPYPPIDTPNGDNGPVMLSSVQHTTQSDAFGRFEIFPLPQIAHRLTALQANISPFDRDRPLERAAVEHRDGRGSIKKGPCPDFT